MLLFTDSNVITCVIIRYQFLQKYHFRNFDFLLRHKNSYKLNNDDFFLSFCLPWIPLVFNHIFWHYYGSRFTACVDIKFTVITKCVIALISHQTKYKTSKMQKFKSPSVLFLCRDRYIFVSCSYVPGSNIILPTKSEWIYEI
jgi:hypothetical protein